MRAMMLMRRRERKMEVGGGDGDGDVEYNDNMKGMMYVLNGNKSSKRKKG